MPSRPLRWICSRSCEAACTPREAATTLRVAQQACVPVSSFRTRYDPYESRAYGERPPAPVTFSPQIGGYGKRPSGRLLSIVVLLTPRGFTPRCEFYPPVRDGGPKCPLSGYFRPRRYAPRPGGRTATFRADRRASPPARAGADQSGQSPEDEGTTEQNDQAVLPQD